jgi:Recombination endonuclease VII
MAPSEEERKEKARQRAHAWYWANRERALEASRVYREANKDKLRESARRTYEKRRASGREQEVGRRWREAHPGHRRARYEADRERELENARRWQAANPERVRDQKREWSRRKKRIDPAGESERFQRMKRARLHGMQPEDWAALWDVQGGRCYLRGDNLGTLPPGQVHVDHDHRCCPKETSCSYCRRGLACWRCNALIGMASDDPARLRRIASNLELALKLADARLSDKPVQASLLDEDAG